MAIIHMLKDTKIYDLNVAEEYFKASINDTLVEIKSSPKKHKSPMRLAKSKSP